MLWSNISLGTSTTSTKPKISRGIVTRPQEVYLTYTPSTWNFFKNMSRGQSSVGSTSEKAAVGWAGRDVTDRTGRNVVAHALGKRSFAFLGIEVGRSVCPVW